MKHLNRWKAEWMRLPRIPFVLGVVIPAMGLVGFKWLGFYLNRTDLIEQGRYSWMSFLASFSLQLHQMLLPLLVAGIVAYLYQIEYEADGWKLSVVQPKGRSRFLTAKFAFSFFGIAVFLAVLILAYLAAGSFLFVEAVPWRTLATMWISGMVFLFPVVAIQHVLTLSTRQPFTAVGVCLAGNLVGSLGADSIRAILPWFYPTLIGAGFESAEGAYLRASGMGLVLMVLAWILMMRRDV